MVTAAVTSFAKAGDLTGLTLNDTQLEALLGLNANVISNTQQTGTINWTFDSAGYAFDYLGAGQTLTLTYTITTTDSQGATDTQNVVITINGNNSAPNITVEPGDSAADGLTETNTTLSSGGTLSALDINTTDTVTAQVSTVSATGTTTGLLSNNAALLSMLSVNANVINNTSTTGTITWAFNSGSEAFNYLAAGETLTLTYTITATDSQGATDTQLVTITITGTNDAPQASAIEGTDLIYTENDAPQQITSNLIIYDHDDSNLESATIQIDHFVPGEDLLAFVDQNGIFSSWNASTGVLTLTGSASVADYQTALRSITYANLSDNPSTVTRTVRFSVNDGTIDSTVIARDIQIVAVNDEQVLSIHSGITVQENSLSNVISASMLRTDDLDNTTSELVYTITSATTYGTLRRNGVSLALGDTFTQADIDANLLTYDHDGSEHFNDAFSFSVDDNQGTTSSATFTIAISPINDNAPVITSHGGAPTVNLNVAENSTAVANIVANDADLPAQTLTYAIQGGTDSNHFAIDSVTGQLTFIAAPDRENPTDSDSDGTYEVVVQVTDGQFVTAQTIRVTVTDENEFAVSTITDNDTQQIPSLRM